MEEKYLLLEKLGYSKEYIKKLEDSENNPVYDKFDYSTVEFESKVFDNKSDTLIIEKPETLFRNSFIYNQKV